VNNRREGSSAIVEELLCNKMDDVAFALDLSVDRHLP